MIVSRETIVAAIDSKEVNRQYLSDGTQVDEERTSCKVRHTGPYYVLTAGISRAADGFNALQAAGSLYREGDSLDDFAARLAEGLPARLTAILETVRAANHSAFDQSFRDQDVVEMSLLGIDYGRPRVVIVAFRASLSGAGRVIVAAHRMTCPGDCLLGIHDEAETFIRVHPEAVGDATTDRALQLIHMEYASHPEVVGGAETVVRVTSEGAVMEQDGACVEPGRVPQLEAELDRTIASVENVVVDEDVAQYSKRGGETRSGEIHAVVRVIGGNEDYAWRGRPSGHLPEPWCGGELATMMRVTRDVLRQGQGTLSAESGSVVMTFHAAETDRHWQLVIGSRTYPLAFDGSAWFSQATGELVRIHWEATDLHLPASAGIMRIEWDETFSTSDIAGRLFLTPSAATYRVSYAWKAERTDWTETRFSDFRRFGATESVQFEQAALR